MVRRLCSMRRMREWMRWEVGAIGRRSRVGKGVRI